MSCLLKVLKRNLYSKHFNNNGVAMQIFEIYRKERKVTQKINPPRKLSLSVNEATFCFLFILGIRFT